MQAVTHTTSLHVQKLCKFNIFAYPLLQTNAENSKRNRDTQSLLNIIFYIQKRNYAPKKHKNIYIYTTLKYNAQSPYISAKNTNLISLNYTRMFMKFFSRFFSTALLSVSLLKVAHSGISSSLSILYALCSTGPTSGSHHA